MNDPNIDAVLRYIQRLPRSPQTMRKVNTGLAIFSSFLLGIWLLSGVYLSRHGGRMWLFFLVTIILVLFCISLFSAEHKAEQEVVVLNKELQHRIEHMTNAEKQHIAEDFAAARDITGFSMRLGKEYLYLHQSNLLLPLSIIAEVYERSEFCINDGGPDDHWIEIYLVTKSSNRPIKIYRSANCPSRKEADAYRRLHELQQQPELAHVTFTKRP